VGLFPKDRNLSLPPDRVEIDVRASDFGLSIEDLSLRLDEFLCHHLSWRSRNSVQHLIQDGDVQLAQAPLAKGMVRGEERIERRASRRVRHGARVVVRIPPDLRLPMPRVETEDLVVLYEDDEVVAVDKPPMLPVHPSGRHLTDTLIQRVHMSHETDEGKLEIPIRLCHRLDRETSGIVLCGKGAENHRHLMRQFERRRVSKEYLAIVHGSPATESGTVDAPIGPSRTSRIHLKMAVAIDGQASRTEWRVEKRYESHCLVSCRPFTGRQHQIRVHMDHIGHPLVGDKLYGVDDGFFLKAAEGELSIRDLRVLGMPRHALHNHLLEFDSPSSGIRRRVESTLPEDMELFLAALG